MTFSHAQELESLTDQSSLIVLLRTLYCMGLDYCLLLPTDSLADSVVFEKDQLVSLIERNSAEMAISDISKQVAEGSFKPVAVFKHDASSGNFVSEENFVDPEKLQVLVVGQDRANISMLKEALVPRAPQFPEWWEAPVPFAMCKQGKMQLNQTAMLMFGPDLKRLTTGDLPDKDEFLVTLEGRQTPCTVTFRRLEEDIFILDDCTNDVLAAADIAWWAAVGKAWVAMLDKEKRAYYRCDAEAEHFRVDHTALPCEWEGEVLGYFCVAKETETKREKKIEKRRGKKVPRFHSAPSTPSASSAPANPTKELEKKLEKQQPQRLQHPHDPHETLRVLGPQTMGLLAPGHLPLENAKNAAEAPADKRYQDQEQPSASTRKNGGPHGPLTSSIA